jgi:hypothetical protein
MLFRSPARCAAAGGILIVLSTFLYGFDGNSNVPPFQSSEQTVRFTRAGNDQLFQATLASGEVTFAYDATYGQLTGIEASGSSDYSLSLTSDPLLHLPLSQTVKQSGATILSAVITYDADGLRASRMVNAAAQGGASSTTSYWYGGGLHPLVVERDGVNYRMIGKGVVETATSQPTRTYAHADYLGSVRLVTDESGAVTQSLAYDGDYGATRIAGQSYAASDDNVASFYRFQGQEQESFPLSKLGIDDDALSAWLDQLQFYHFPWRDYAAGLAAFLETDPIPTEDSPYAAFAADPANVTDETGGMNFPTIYTPAQRFFSQDLQSLLDRVEADPLTPLSDQQLLDLRRLHTVVRSQRDNPHNPFLPRRLVPDTWDEQSNSYALKFVPITDERNREAMRAFVVLRQEQNQWIRRYNFLMDNEWHRQRWLLAHRAELNTAEDEDESKDDEKDDAKGDGKDDEKASEASADQPGIGAPESPTPPHLFGDDEVENRDDQQDERVQEPSRSSADSAVEPNSREDRPMMRERDLPEEPQARSCCSIL